MDIKNIKRIGIAKFETAKQNRIGFHIIQSNGLFKEFAEQNQCRILQLPREVEIIGNICLHAGLVLQSKYSKNRYFIFSLYKYAGLDQTNRTSYIGASIGYEFDGYQPSSRKNHILIE